MDLCAIPDTDFEDGVAEEEAKLGAEKENSLAILCKLRDAKNASVSLVCARTSRT